MLKIERRGISKVHLPIPRRFLSLLHCCYFFVLAVALAAG